MMEIRIFVEEKEKSGRYRAELADGQVLVETSRQPFFDGARELLRRGANPDATLIMARRSTGTESLRAKLGEAAKLTVAERDRGGARFEPWSPDSRFR